MRTKKIKIKHIYGDYSDEDGYRVLVDRLWPRGISKEEARLDEWLKGIAPSTELRKWFDHDADKFSDFRKRYESELADKKEAVSHLLKKAGDEQVTLLYAARDKRHNHAVVLQGFLRKMSNQS